MAEHTTLSDPREDLRRIADVAQEQLRGAVLSRPARRTVEAMVTRVRRAGDYQQARQAIDDTAAELARLTALVDALRADLQQEQVRRSKVEPFGPAWRDLVTRLIADADDVRARAVWICHYAEAFVAARFDTCEWLSGPSGLLADRDLARRMYISARAAKDSNLAASLPALEALTESTLDALLPEELRLKAWCMRIRAICRGVGDPPRARDMARRLVDETSAQQPPAQIGATLGAALQTVLGECLLASEDPEGAVRESRQALRDAPQEPAGHVLRGLIAEAAENFTRADEWYEDAADVGGARAVTGELFAPIPPNLLWKYGHLVRETDPREAARLIRKALRLGIRGVGEYPERKAYVDLGWALQKRPDRSAEAAKAFWEAGRRYAWIGDETSAMTYLDNACRLAPQEARYTFERAEVLRIRAVREDGTVDHRRLDEAAQAWRDAYSTGRPDRDAAWAYLTMALILHEESGDLYRPRASWEATAMLERGMLADPHNIRIAAQLSQAHRLLGNRWTALQLSTAVLDRGGDDDLVFDQHLLALMEVGRYGEALELLDRHGLTSQQPWLVNRKGQLLVALNDPQRALDLLDSVTPSDPALHDLQVALCHHLLGRHAAARETAQRVCDREAETLPGRRTYLLAQACYLVGRYDQAIAAYQSLVDEDPVDTAIRCDLGQALLARGEEASGDIAQGRRQLLDGIADTRSVFSLGYLEEIELPWLLDLVAGEGHQAAVQAAVDEVVAAVRQRRARLIASTGSPDELTTIRAETSDPAAQASALAGLARLELADGRAEQALERYLDLAHAGWLEASYGIDVAAQRLQTVADRLARAGDQLGAVDAYARLLDRLGRASNVDLEIVASTNLRASLSALELDRPAQFAEHVARAFPAGLPNRAVAALRTTVSHRIVRPEQYWKIVDAAHELRDRPGIDEAAIAAATRLVSTLDLSVLLRTGRDDIHATRIFPLAVPLAVHVDPVLLDKEERSGQSLGDLLTRMRSRVEQETGVFLPVIDARPLGADSQPGSYKVDLYEVALRSGRVPVGRHFVRGGDAADDHIDLAAEDLVDPLTGETGHWVERPPFDIAGSDRVWSAPQFVVRRLEAVIRANLPRMFSIDDVGLWLSAIRAKPVDTADADRLSRADRLELLRLLRLLLREQVPIVERGEIFQAVCRAGAEWSALDALPVVRSQIKACLAPWHVLDSPPAMVPADLEAMAAKGLSAADAGTWELPRTEVHAIADRILAWRADSPRPVVVVRNPRLRPFFWRLLVSLVPGPVWILSEEELP